MNYCYNNEFNPLEMVTCYDIHHPSQMPGSILDDYLNKGWYRIQQTMMTTDLIHYEDSFVPVFWLRIALDRYRLQPTGRKIYHAGRTFTIHCVDGIITPEIEALFYLYKSSIAFQLGESASEYLLGNGQANIFNSRIMEIRDEGRLIAAGFFDIGEDSLAGILNIIHPGYRNKSLGKLLMLAKIDFGIREGKTYYYPGYYSTGTTKFDYKLFPDKEATEVFLRNENAWVPYLSISDEELEDRLFGED